MSTAPTRGYTATKDQLLNRLRRIQGQVGGVERMVEEDRYCIDVLTQISAVQAALDKVALGLLDEHARHCVMGAQGGAGRGRRGPPRGAPPPLRDGRPGRGPGREERGAHGGGRTAHAARLT